MFVTKSLYLKKTVFQLVTSLFSVLIIRTPQILAKRNDFLAILKISLQPFKSRIEATKKKKTIIKHIKKN